MKTGKITIYNNWEEECKPNVNKVKGVLGYCGCKDEIKVGEFIIEKLEISFDELIDLFDNGNIAYKNFNLNKLKNNPIKTVDKKVVDETVNKEYPKGVLYIYVDGSYSGSKKNYSYGVVVVDKDEEIIYEDKGVGKDPDAVALRQICGEIEGAKKAIEYAEIENAYEIVICYDYKGVELWAAMADSEAIRHYSNEKPWKADNKFTQEYKKFMHEKQKNMKIHFKKIDAHTGHEFNERADELAKEALGIKK
ncbi:hypothetical protein HYG84_19940 (plasmid) [Alkaliphilus sp. B6464]|nr:hypothetical protein HYG84_19940 [Alkaliphilus sp. B6464]